MEKRIYIIANDYGGEIRLCSALVKKETPKYFVLHHSGESHSGFKFHDRIPKNDKGEPCSIGFMGKIPCSMSAREAISKYEEALDYRERELHKQRQQIIAISVSTI